MSPNSSPMIAKMKSLLAFGRNRPPASRLSPSPAPRIPPRPSASRPWIVWKPAPERVGPWVEPGLDAVELVAAQAGDDDRGDRDEPIAREMEQVRRRPRRTS